MINKKQIEYKILDHRFNKWCQYCYQQPIDVNRFSQYIKDIQSQNLMSKIYGIIGLRRLLSSGNEQYIEMVINQNAASCLVKLLDFNQCIQIQMQSAWAIANMAFGSIQQCSVIINEGVIQKLVNLSYSNQQLLVIQAVWGIGNISSQNITYRNLSIDSGCIQACIHVISVFQQNKQILNHGCWALSNLCRTIPLPKYSIVKQSINMICQMLKKQRITDKQIIGDCLWTLAQHSQNNDQLAHFIQHYQIIQFLRQSLQKFTESILIIPIIRILGNLIANNGASDKTSKILQLNTLQIFNKLLDHHRKIVRRQICWILSNIAAGQLQNVNKLFQNQIIMDKLVSLFSTDSIDVKKQIIYILTGLINKLNKQKIWKFYIQKNVFLIFIAQFKSFASNNCDIYLQNLEVMLKLGNQFMVNGQQNIFVTYSNQNNITQDLQKLRNHQNEHISELAFQILNSYFYKINDIFTT